MWQREAGLKTAYRAGIVAITYEEMGLIATDRQSNWFEPGSLWSGDTLPPVSGYQLGRETAVTAT